MALVAPSDGLRARKGGIWTRDKLDYLRKYAGAFMTAMAPKRAAGKWSRLVFIDLLCGPGIDIINGEEHRGSPLIAVNTVPPFDRLFLGDIKPSNVHAVSRRIPPAEMHRVDLQVGDCHVRAQQIVAGLGWGDLGFAFIDPEGFEVRFEMFSTLSQRRVDLLLLFPSGIGIKRNVPQFARQVESRMDGLWGNRDWRQLPSVRRLAGETLLPWGIPSSVRFRVRVCGNRGRLLSSLRKGRRSGAARLPPLICAQSCTDSLVVHGVYLHPYVSACVCAVTEAGCYAAAAAIITDGGMPALAHDRCPVRGHTAGNCCRPVNREVRSIAGNQVPAG